MKDVIKGIHGQEQIEIDAKGRLQRIVTSTDPQQGNNLNTSIDSRLQTTAYQSLFRAVTEKGNGKGAAIASIQIQEKYMLSYHCLIMI